MHPSKASTKLPISTFTLYKMLQLFFYIGRRQVAETAQFKRLVFVSLSREHHYEDMQQIQNELSAKVLELAPTNLPRSYKARF